MSKVYCIGLLFSDNTPIGCGNPDCQRLHNWNELKKEGTPSVKTLKFVDATYCIHNGHCHYKKGGRG